MRIRFMRETTIVYCSVGGGYRWDDNVNERTNEYNI
jgi:hypothetical protein